MAYKLTLETEDGSLHDRGTFTKKSIAFQVAKAAAFGTNLQDAVRYLVETEAGQTVKAFPVKREG